MNRYESNTTPVQAAALLHSASSVLIVTHAKPDGDAFGSVVAMAQALGQLGKQVHAVLAPPVPANFRLLRGAERCRLHDRHTPLPDSGLVLVLDTGAWTQLAPLDTPLRARLSQMLIIDHHLSGDVPAPHRCIDGQAAACCEIVAQVLDELAPPSQDAAANPLWSAVVREALFVGIASDTGWFRFSNTRPFTHDLAARLIRSGVDHADLYRSLEQDERPQKLALMIRALDSLELLASERAAVMVLRARDFAQTGALLEETERFVDLPQVVSTVELVVLITQSPPQGEDRAHATANGSGHALSSRDRLPGDDQSALIRLSFRSKAGRGAVDVAALAQEFGGGGHARAAGAKLTATLNDAIARVRKAVERAVS